MTPQPVAGPSFPTTIGLVVLAIAAPFAADMFLALEREGRPAEAISCFHRAIYGKWDKDGAENRLRVRYELIDLLAKGNSGEELLAGLLPRSGSGS